MRVRRLLLKSFRNLRDFELQFSEEPFTTVLVGHNGTGKSNVLEALVIIFRDLDLGAPPELAYELDYTCRGSAISVRADPQQAKSKLSIKVDGNSISPPKFSRKAGGEFLPKYLFGYYSGPSNRMDTLFEKHQKQFTDDLLAGVDRPLRPLLYARLVHSQFVLMSFFCERGSEERGLLDEYLGIEDLESILFVLKRPGWYSPSRRVEGGDSRFWMARGVVQGFLDKLYRLALAPVRSERKRTKGTSYERLYLYLKDKKDLLDLAAPYLRPQDQSPQEFFKALESTYISDLIADVRPRVRLRNVGGALTFRELAEGEQQLLMVLGLLRFTKEDEALFLLDEPDTHLNPAWSLEYLNLLERYVGRSETSQIIMATHDPLVIAGLTREQVRILRRDDRSRVTCEMPEEDPKGMGVAALLTSDVYGLRSELDIKTMELLDRKHALAVKESRSPEEDQELVELNRRIESLGFTTAFRDPMYTQFVKAMAKAQSEHGLDTHVLTKEQQKKQEQIALQIVKRLRSEREGVD